MSSEYTINDLEALIAVIGKLIKDKLKEKPKAGITLEKDCPNERRITYKEAQALYCDLVALYAEKGCFSIGVCETCTHWDNAASGSKVFGLCPYAKEKLCHKWDTCHKHSKEGGGYGV